MSKDTSKRDNPMVSAYAALHRARVCNAIEPYRVYLISYRTRDLTGHGDHEEGEFEGFCTRERDTWGKATYRPVDGGTTLYLFDDEIVGVDEL